MAEKKKYNSILVSGRKDETLTYSKFIKDEESGESVKESLDKKVNVTDKLETQQIKDGAITNEKMAAGSVGNTNLQDGSVSNEKLEDGSITNEKLAENSITKDKLKDNTIGVEKLDTELRQTINAATGLPENLVETIQNVDDTLKDHQSQLDDKQSQIDDKQQQITANDEDISLLQTRSTQMEKAIKDISASGGASQASAVTYENTESGLDSITAQGAIDELANKKFNKENIAQEFGDSEDKVVSQSALPFREIESPEFIKAVVDSEDHFLFGIQLDGSIEWGKGIPAPIRAKLQEIINQCQQDKTDILEAINAAKKELSASITALQENKVDKEEGKSLIEDEVKECFRIIENEEFLKAIVDSDDKVLFGFYRATGKPYYPLNEMYHVIQNEEYFAAWVTTDDKVVLGLRRDGEIIGEIHAVNALKQVISQLQSDLASLQEKVGTIDTNLKELLDVFSMQDNEEYLAVEQDAEGKILSSTNLDGSHYIHNVKSETIPTEFNHIEDPEGRTEMTTDADGKILGYRDKDGMRCEHKMQIDILYKDGEPTNYASKEYVDKKKIDASSINITELNGVIDNSLDNLFDKSKIRTYDSDFATKVFNAIGRKTDETGCYSNNIPCNEGDWFTRNDFGTGIVIALDADNNILGDVKNAAYHPTIQIKASEGQDFSTVAYVVMVVMLSNLESQKIVNAKYIPTEKNDTINIPKLKVSDENIKLGITTFVKSTNDRYYKLSIDDSSTEPKLVLTKIEGIPSSNLPSEFPVMKISGDFSKYYKSLVFSIVEGGERFLIELNKINLVSRYINKTVNCPRIIEENGALYYYGVDGGFNVSSGKLNIYEAKEESFSLVKGNITDTMGELLEPHDCLVLSVNPLHVITQRYISNVETLVDGERKIVTALHVEEQYDGKRCWLWKSEDYPELWKDSFKRGNNADYLHNNTIDLDVDGNLILNNKHADQILIIKRTWNDVSKVGTIGEIIWKIGGRNDELHKDSYDVPTRIKTTSSEQWNNCHDATQANDGRFTLFNNGGTNGSEIVEFFLDKVNKRVKNLLSYSYKNYRGWTMGSVERIDNGIYLVSWGGSRESPTPNLGIYDFINNKTLFEISFSNTACAVYRVYSLKNK